MDVHELTTVLISAEHASNTIPAQWAHLFATPEAQAALHSHRGWDPGTAEPATEIARAAQQRPHLGVVSRLLIELNRSLNHPQLWSEYSRKLSDSEQGELLARYYQPHRDLIEAEVAAHIRAQRRVVHIALHSFTPVWDNRDRTVDIGFLFDPDRPSEVARCAKWKMCLHQQRPDLRLRDNEPYHGIDDGLTSHLRRRFPDPHYAGIEVEVNQRFPLGEAADWHALRAQLVKCLVV